MLKIAVCDDDERFIYLATNILKKYKENELEIEGFTSGKEFLNYFYKNRVDIVYLDIELGGRETGIDIAKRLKLINPKVLIIYMSGYDTFYKDIANAEPFRFIDKISVFDNKAFLEPLRAAIERLEINKSILFTYNFNGQMYNIDVRSIKYFYSKKRLIYIKSNQDLDQEYFYSTMDDLESNLKNICDMFGRINRCYIVNMMQIKVYKRSEIKIGEEVLKLSSQYSQSFLPQYYEYRLSHMNDMSI